MHISSLPSPYGIGTTGAAAFEFADFLKDAGQKYWQVLPLGPTGYGDSPYQSFSMYAGNPYLIDLDLLAEAGLLKRSELAAIDWGDNPRFADYGRLYENRAAVLREAEANLTPPMREKIEVFRGENAAWLEDYALFTALKKHFCMAPWLEWEQAGLRMHETAELANYREKLRPDIDHVVFTQYLFWTQWAELRKYANSLGISLIGDIPIYASLDSCDVWAHPEYYELDEERRPLNVSGVPPDYFSEDGQLWGNPLYDWAAIKADGYRYWLDRIRAAESTFDVARIDHFRGLESYWSVKRGETTARNGEWRPGPGMELINAIKDAVPALEIVAEDLGILTPAVKKLLAESGYPGMKVLQFAFGGASDNDYLPHNFERSCICYTGTHDNATAAGWASELTESTAGFVAEYTGETSLAKLPEALIRTGASSVADVFITQMQDWLGLGDECRMNTPGRPDGNWRWRALPGELTQNRSDVIARITRLYGR